jgi:hypothetical protein
MIYSINMVLLGALYAGGLFLGILLTIQAGRFLRTRQSGDACEVAHPGLRALEGALFGLMSLILAFSFSGAGTRFDSRRQLLVDEANCIGTAYLRLDVFRAEAQKVLKAEFRQYADARLSAFRAIPDIQKAEVEVKRAIAIQNRIWERAVAAIHEANEPQAAMIVVLPALNEMFDIANTQYMATRIHPPAVIYGLMGVLILVCALLVGYRMGESKTTSWVHILSFAGLLALTFYVTLDMEFPRLGLIQIRNFDQALVDVRNSMGEG